MGYSPDSKKHLRIWILHIKQIVIASKPYINKSEKGAKLLAKWPLDITQTKKKVPVEESKPRDRPQKNPIKVYIEIPMEPDIVSKIEVAISITKTIGKI